MLPSSTAYLELTLFYRVLRILMVGEVYFFDNAFSQFFRIWFGRIYESKSVADLGVVFAWLSVGAVILVLLLAVYIKVLLPRDYDGPATEGER